MCKYMRGIIYLCLYFVLLQKIITFGYIFKRNCIFIKIGGDSLKLINPNIKYKPMVV